MGRPASDRIKKLRALRPAAWKRLAKMAANTGLQECEVLELLLAGTSDARMMELAGHLRKRVEQRKRKHEQYERSKKHG